MYAIVKLQVDIVFAMSIVSQFVKNPSSEHFNAIDQISQYVAGCAERGVTFGGDDELKLID